MTNHTTENTPGKERVQRSRLLILGSLGAAAASGGCFGGEDLSGIGRESQRISREATAEQRANEEAWRQEGLRRQAERTSQSARPAAPPQMTTPSGTEGGGGGGGGGSH